MADLFRLDVMNPRSQLDTIDSRPAPRLGTLRGKTIGVIDNKKSGARPFLEQVKSLLARDYPDAKFIDLSKSFNEQHRMKEYLGQLHGIDAAIYSTGD
jgi:hypothetical protein